MPVILSEALLAFSYATFEVGIALRRVKLPQVLGSAQALC